MSGVSHIPRTLIGEHLEFIPSRRELIDDNLTKKIKLQVPASLCLERLLQKKGEVVSQEELILFGWGEKRSATVSANAYYQCILHLRKSLATMGFSDFIVTVPRQGLKINDAIRIVITDDQQAEGTNHESEKMQAQKTLHTVPPLISASRTTAPRVRYSINLILLSIVLVTGLYALSSVTRNENAWQDYTRLGGKDCNMYVSEKKVTQAILLNDLKAVKLTCANNATIFATTSPMNNSMNIVYCSLYTTSQQNCRSLTLMNDIRKQP